MLTRGKPQLGKSHSRVAPLRTSIRPSVGCPTRSSASRSSQNVTIIYLLSLGVTLYKNLTRLSHVSFELHQAYQHLSMPCSIINRKTPISLVLNSPRGAYLHSRVTDISKLKKTYSKRVLIFRHDVDPNAFTTRFLKFSTEAVTSMF